MSALDGATRAHWRENAEENMRCGFSSAAFLSSEQTLALLDALEEARTNADDWEREHDAAEAGHDRLQVRVNEALAACDKALAANVASSPEVDAAAAGASVGIRRILSAPTEKEEDRG